MPDIIAAWPWRMPRVQAEEAGEDDEEGCLGDSVGLGGTSEDDEGGVAGGERTPGRLLKVAATGR